MVGPQNPPFGGQPWDQLISLLSEGLHLFPQFFLLREGRLSLPKFHQVCTFSPKMVVPISNIDMP